MYKLFVNGITVYIAHKHGAGAFDESTPDDKSVLITDKTRNKDLQPLVHQLNTGSTYRSVYLMSRSPKQVLNRFKKFYQVVNAAGGVVMNKNENLLMIFRRGKWDLPKGKADGKESKRRTAVREVKEETDVKKLRVIQQVKLYPAKQTCTYHTYYENGKHILKATTWYLMRSTSDEPLTPQFDEDISLAEWVPLEEVDERLAGSYPLLRDVIEYALPRG